MRFFFIVIAIVVLDQISKQWVLAQPEWFKTFNDGIAFSLPLTGTLALVTAVILTVILFFSSLRIHPKTPLMDMGFALVIGGSLGNIIDRVQYGAVVDFIRFGTFPAFNLADSSITIGVFLLLISFRRPSLSS